MGDSFVAIDTDKDGSGDRAKVRAVGISKTEFNKYFGHLQKACLNNAQMIRLLVSATFLRIYIKGNNFIVEAAAKAGIEFNKETKGISKHGKGSPHTHQAYWAMRKAMESTHCDPARKTCIGNFLTNFDSPSKIGRAITQFHRQKRKDGMVTVYMSAVNEHRQPMLALSDILEFEGGKVWEGTAPPSALERQLQQDMKDLGQWTPQKWDD
jgi:hypothetical protein